MTDATPPNFVRPDGSRIWTDDEGRYHRYDGPAIEHANGKSYFFWHGRQIESLDNVPTATWTGHHYIQKYWVDTSDHQAALYFLGNLALPDSRHVDMYALHRMWRNVVVWAIFGNGRGDITFQRFTVESTSSSPTSAQAWFDMSPLKTRYRKKDINEYRERLTSFIKKSGVLYKAHPVQNGYYISVEKIKKVSIDCRKGSEYE